MYTLGRPSKVWPAVCVRLFAADPRPCSPPPPPPPPCQNNDKAMLTYNILAKITDFTRKMDDSEP